VGPLSGAVMLIELLAMLALALILGWGALSTAAVAWCS
jgi:hypothetical protein